MLVPSVIVTSLLPFSVFDAEFETESYTLVESTYSARFLI